MRISRGCWPDEPLAEGNCVSVSERGEEAGEQNLDLMDKNRVKRHGALGKLARDSEAQKGSKRLDVNAAGVRGKSWHLIRGGLSKRTEVSRGHSSRWSNDHPGRMGKLIYRAKGRTEKELSRKERDSISSRHLGGKKPERTWR